MADPIQLPTPGGNENNWGNMLNDFLRVEHNEDGTLKKDSLITGAQQASQKGQANGYAPLSSDGIVDDAYLPFHGRGDYLGLQAYSTVIPASSPSVFGFPFDYITAQRNVSIIWDGDGQPTLAQIQTDGVYAVSLTVDWADSSDSTPSLRNAGIWATCGFRTSDQRANVTGIDTVQSLSFTVTLQAGQHIQVNLTHASTNDLTPDIMLLVTKVAQLDPEVVV